MEKSSMAASPRSFATVFCGGADLRKHLGRRGRIDHAFEPVLSMLQILYFLD